MAALLFLPFFLLLVTTSHLMARKQDTTNNTISQSRLLQTLDTFASTNSKKFSKSSLFLPVFLESFGGYSVSLSFGTPPQIIRLIVDTGGSLVWFPCGPKYSCFDCSYPSIDLTKIPTFYPSSSSSYKTVQCNNPKCWWVVAQTTQPQCRTCNLKNAQTCSQPCPPYRREYGTGSTIGILLLEKLNFPKQTIYDFLVGCSSFSVKQPFGIVGFGRGLGSLPLQIGVKKFSYCLSGSILTSKTNNGYLILNNSRFKFLHYTPFYKTQAPLHAYYYVILEDITVGDKVTSIPHKIPNSYGYGGMMIDSGSSYSLMERSIFNGVVQEFMKQTSDEIHPVGSIGLLKHCFNISRKTISDIPKLAFRFKGGATMKLPRQNYLYKRKDIVCLSILSRAAHIPNKPAITLGNYQMQNFYMEFDLKNERLGFVRKSCN